MRAVEGVEVEHVSDRTFLLHLGGRSRSAEVAAEDARRPLDGVHAGVARISPAIADDPATAWNLTIKQNTVAVVTDGTAVLGLGDIGPEAAMPVMEGKALLFKEFAGVDAWPLCLATKDVDEIVAVVKAIAPGFGGINLEDISAPRCFEIEERCARSSTSLSSTTTSTAPHRRPRRDRERAEGRRQARSHDVRVVITGAGAAGVAVADILSPPASGT